MYPDALLDQVVQHSLPRTYYRDLPLLPLVVLEGPLASGKTDTLDRLEARWRDRATVLSIKMQGVPDATSPRTVVVALAATLHARTAAVRFPRLSLGLAALAVSAAGDLEGDQRRLEARLARRDQVVRTVNDVVEQVRKDLPTFTIPFAGDVGVPGAQLVASGLGSLTWTLRVRRARRYRWFAEETDASTPVGGLMMLRQADQGTADALLVQAFLADLRESFTSWSKQEQLRSNVLLLVDDGDAEAGRRFLTALLEARAVQRQRHDADRDDPERVDEDTGDPLLVVASSGRRSETVLALPGVNRSAFVPAGSGRHRTRGGAGVHALPLLRPVAAQPGDHDDRVCRALAAGNARAERLLREQQATRGGAPLAAVLSHVAARLLRDCPSPRREDLCAAAAVHRSDPGRAQLNAALTHPAEVSGAVRGNPAERQRDLKEFVSDRLWAPHGTTDLHPFIRRALLHRLSEIRDADPGSWRSVLGRLGDEHPEGTAWRLHYRLARDADVAAVAPALTRNLYCAGERYSWVRDLDVVTSAPFRGSASDATDHTHRLESVAGDQGALAEDERQVATIVGVLWLSRNLLGSPDLFDYVDAADALRSLGHRRSLSSARRQELQERALTYEDHRRATVLLDVESFKSPTAREAR